MNWLCFLFAGLMAFSQTTLDGERPDNPEYLAHSRLLTFRLIPQGKKAELYISGNKAANVFLNDPHRLIEVTAISPNHPKQVLEFRNDGQAYVISKLPDWEEDFQVAIKTETRGKVEQTNISLKPARR